MGRPGKDRNKPKKRRNNRQRRPPSGLEDTIVLSSMIVAAHLLRRFLPELNKAVTSEVCRLDGLLARGIQ